MREIGNRDHRNEHGAQRAEEKKDNNDDDEERLHQGVDDFVDRGVDVFRAVVGDAALKTGGKFLLNLHQLSPDPLDDVDRIGIRQNENAHENSALAGEPDLRVVILGAEYHICDVAQPDEDVVFLPHDKILEILH